VKLLKDTNKGWNKGNVDGFDHLVYALISYGVGWLIFPPAIPYIFIVNTIIWLYLEHSQEKAMVKKSNGTRKYRWSQKRHQDWGLPTIAGLINLGVYFA